MPAAERTLQAAYRRLAWSVNGDNLDVALAVNRLQRAGADIWWAPSACAGFEAGDFLVAMSPGETTALEAFGLVTSSFTQEIPSGLRRLSPVRAGLLCGRASRYPYDGYYALCLLRIGIDVVPLDGRAIAAGALEEVNLFVIPGGFAIWGIDRAEEVSGADAAVRAFLARGGAAIGSCGGAFYLSAGRPGWTGTAPAKPVYTHEYLQSGVGIVTLGLSSGPLAAGCPPTIEVPYYHGPIYDELGPGVETLATFRSLALPGGLAIDNPLDDERFRRDLAGRPAILSARGPRGRAILFSPHPEMGDLVRKYIAVDGYVRRYLPVRGYDTLHDTMRHYRVLDAPSFRLVSNAIHWLSQDLPVPPAEAVTGARPLPAEPLRQALRSRLAALEILGGGGEARLLRSLVADLTDRLAPAARQPDGARASRHERDHAALDRAWNHFAAAVLERAQAASGLPVAQELMEAELALSIMDCRARVAAFDRLLQEAG